MQTTSGPKERTYGVNIRTTGNQIAQQDSYIPFTFYETTDSDQTFRKEQYFEIDEEGCFLHGHVHETHWYGMPIFPRRPAHNWNLRLFLVELSKEVTDDDLDIVKFILTGTEDGGRGSMQYASRLKVFDLMQTKRFITSNDLLYLQVILAVVGKESLINKVYQYAQNTENVLHFDPPLKSFADDHVTDICVSGADFRFYTQPELDEFCTRIKRMVSVRHKNRVGCTVGRIKMCISLMHLEETDSFSNVLLHEFEETRCMDHLRIRPYVVYCNIGIQTEENISDHTMMILEENKRLKEQLLDAEHKLQKQANEISAMAERLNLLEEARRSQLSQDNPSAVTEVFGVIGPCESKRVNTDNTELCEEIGPNENARENTDVTALTVKDIEYELNARKKEHEIQSMKVSSLSEKCETLQSKYDEAVNENKDLKVEKINTDIQVAILQRNLDDLGAKLKKRIEEENDLIEELRNKLAMTTASLLNVQNDKRLHELTRLLEQISSMSMTVKKVYGNFDPAHEPISPKQDELFRKSMSGKIGRIFPQIYYTPNKR